MVGGSVSKWKVVGGSVGRCVGRSVGRWVGGSFVGGSVVGGFNKTRHSHMILHTFL